MKSPSITRSPTEFERRVYDAVVMIPPGRVTTYGALARFIGCASPRAVGQALSRNPFAPDVPCHRVIATNLEPGGFAGQTDGPELRRKLQLLASEGLTFVRRAGKLVLNDQHVVVDLCKHGKMREDI